MLENRQHAAAIAPDRFLIAFLAGAIGKPRDAVALAQVSPGVPIARGNASREFSGVAGHCHVEGQGLTPRKGAIRDNNGVDGFGTVDTYTWPRRNIALGVHCRRAALRDDGDVGIFARPSGGLFLDPQRAPLLPGA